MTYGEHNAEDSCLKNQHGSYPAQDEAINNCPAADRGDPEKPPVPAPDHAGLEYGAIGQPDNTGSAPIDHQADLEFPEGGLQAWLVVFGAFCGMLSVYGLINTAAVFESYFSQNQLRDYTSSQIGWIFSVYLFIVFIVGIQVGPVFDKHGPRLIVASGGILIATSLFLLSVCEAYYQILLSYSIVGGLGGALLNSPSYAAIAHWFDVRRGLATGIAMTAGSIGGIIFPIVLQKLLPSIGFGWTVRILGFIILGLTLPATLFMRSRLPRQNKVSSVWPEFGIFRDLKFTFSALGVFFMEWGLFVPLTYIVSYAGRNSGDANSSYTLISILNAGSLLGRFLPGLLADKIGRFNVILLTLGLCIISAFALWLPAGDSNAMITTFAVIFGFASGSNLGLTPVCVGQLCDPRDYGRYISAAFMVASFGTLSSLPIAGALLEAGHNGDTGWTALIVFDGLSYVLALACFLAARVMAVGWNVKRVY
ncbi:monocarboxylate transporter [Fusarium heterosporum]|uniref:Monocarboxylate transporter n=1 Tax=Fusarium heterosporum TaxID=42747 RepID=A0A8H5T540_FUSHE|nr:monocarboxylate transporter [Fusarium heterosporum]